MLHLFNKVYISSDSAIDVNFDRVVVSEKYGVKMYEALDKISYGELIRYGQNLNEALGDDTFTDFIDTLQKRCETYDKKIIIYADSEGFSAFMSMWLKAIFRNISASAAWKIVDCYVQKQDALRNWRTTTTATQTSLFEGLTEKDFVTDFNDAPQSNVNVDNVSFELLLADYFIDQSHKEQLKSAAHNLLKRSVKELAVEIKHSYIKNKNRTNFLSIAKDEQFFTNSTIYTDSSIGQVSNLASSVNLNDVSDEDVVKFKTIAKKLITDWDQFKATSSIIKFVDMIDIARKDSLTDDDLSYIIDFEKNSRGTIRIFSSADEEKINVYFLDYIMNCSEEELKEYDLK